MERAALSSMVVLKEWMRARVLCGFFGGGVALDEGGLGEGVDE